MHFLIFLIGTAYLVLLERHIMGVSQLRTGPAKAGYSGVLQPLCDGFKLFRKSVSPPGRSRFMWFYLSPLILLLLLGLELQVLPHFIGFLSFGSSALFFLCLLGSGVYVFISVGFSSYSNNSYLAAIRSSAQSISFEVVMVFFVFAVVMSLRSYSLVLSTALSFFYLLVFGFILCLVESGRAPFDFLEAESELVTGYHLECGGVLFVYIFLSEYGFVLFFSALLSSLFFAGSLVFACGFLYFFVLVRSSFPRYRYDKMMGLCWYYLLPLGASMVVFFYAMSSCF